MWKRGLVALSATAIVAALLFVISDVAGPETDRAQLTPAESGRSSSPPETGLPRLPGSRDGVTFAARPTPKERPEAFDPAEVAALKSLLKKSHTTLAAPTPAPSSSARPPPVLDFTLSSFNVLGSRHSAPGGTRSGMAPALTRIRWTASLLARHGVDVVGFQEMQLDQARSFLRNTRGTYNAYPGFAAGGRGANNSIAWRTDVWELVDARTIPIPYFNGSRWPMPVVLLRSRETGLSAYFTNFHNPASTPRHPNQARWRSLALATEVALVNRLTRETDHPVFLTGDMNERETAFCAMTGRAPMIAANGGSHSGSCRPPRPIGIDWIFGSVGVTFSNYKADRSPLVNRTSDHPMIVSDVRIEG